jgi:beta-galactosidase
MKNVVFYILAVITLMACSNSKTEQQIEPGEPWQDTEGQLINAHGGGILYDQGTYYWYGEYKKGPTKKVEEIIDWECYRTDAVGISCYSSKDLMNWHFEGIVLEAEQADSTHDLHFSKVIERPKVLYNKKTGKYVMWMHVDSFDYSFARSGVAISSDPKGPFTYLGSVRPYGQMSRDMTLFLDDDGSAYHIFSSEHNATMYISLLNDDFLSHSDHYVRIFENEFREAPSMIKCRGKYYLLTSGCTGWDPNEASYAVSDSVFGDWTVAGNPCTGSDSELTFLSQCSYLTPVGNQPDRFVFMADRWNKTRLETSSYVWLPGKISDGQMEVKWLDQWGRSDLGK